MAEPPVDRDAPTDHDAVAATTGVPRWVKAFGVVVLALVVLLVGLKVAGVDTGDHSPGRHLRGEPPTETVDDPGGAHDPSRRDH